MNLKIENLNFNYAEKILFKNLNLHFDSDTFTWIRGPSGSGKSTFLKLVAGLLPNQSGNILFSKDEATIGYVDQECHLVDHWSVEENLRLAEWADRNHPNAKTGDVDFWLKKFDLNISKKALAKTLSGGERQRICLIRVLLQNPDVVLLDEPTAHLDDQHATTALQLLSDGLRSKLLLIVSHDQRLSALNFKTLDWKP